MNEQLINRLCALNTDFYRKTAGSFSSTRRSAWPGWERLACIAEDALGLEPAPNADLDTSMPEADSAPERMLHVVDLACGNMRFETFLESRLASTGLSFTTVDNCDGFPLTPVESPCSFVNADLIKVLQGDAPAALEGIAQANLAVSFGFAHHVPGRKLRAALIKLITGMLAPGGIAAVSFWNFMQNREMAQKAEASTERAQRTLQLPPLEEGDFILGWQNERDAFRYCHSFSGDEIDELAGAAHPETRLTDRFEADGRTGNLNTYLVFQREGWQAL